MNSAPAAVADYQKSVFAARTSSGSEISHDIYQRGTGNPVVLIQELPGIGQETLHLADKLIDSGFKVVLPHLFGPIGKTSIVGNLARVFCMRQEFHLFQANQTSPVVDWLKALCQQVRSENDVKGVGVIGMCLTGNFAITLMADDSVLAAVASQPAMPFGKSSALHMSDADIEMAKKGIDGTAPIKAYRFAEDPMCNAAKFGAIDEAFNQNGQSRVELNVLPGKGHSVLTLDFVDEAGHPTRNALDSILDYFKQQLAAQ